jgi:hypothetical protein
VCASDEAEHKPHQGQHPAGEDRIADDTQSAQRIHDTRLQELGGAGVLGPVLYRRPSLEEPDRQQTEEHHQCQSYIDGPKRRRQRPIFPGRTWEKPAQAEQHQADPQHAIDPEQRRVGVHGRGVEPLRIVQGDGRIDQEAEQPGADEVPKGHPYAKGDRPAIRREPAPGARQPHIFPGLEADQHERHDFQRTEHDPQCEDDIRRAGEIEMMERANDTPSEEDDRGEEHRCGRGLGRKATSTPQPSLCNPETRRVLRLRNAT